MKKINNKIFKKPIISKVLIIIFLLSFSPFLLFNDNIHLGSVDRKNKAISENLFPKSENVIINSLPKNSLYEANLGAKDAYAIVIGISDYPGTDNDLNYCDDDAQEIYSMLINDYNFKSENLIYLQESAATKSAISSAFDTINAQITSNDVFFFYYSGHGGRGTQNAGVYSYSIESPHPYDNNYDTIWPITHTDAAYMRVHFDTIHVESNYDYILIGDTELYNGYYYEGYTGIFTDIWSNWIPLLNDNTLCVNLLSDISNSEPYWGFLIDQYEVITYDGSHYLCSYDSIPSSPSNYYLDSLLDSKLDAMNCNQKYIVMDSCNSGGLIPETQSAGRYIMSAAQDDELSLEDSGRQNGVFTYNFLRSLDMATDSNGDGVISMEERYDYTYSTTVSRSTALGYTHHPQEYDGISGESILLTSIYSESFNLLENQLDYTFQISGTGKIDHLVLGICSIDSSNVYDYTFLDLSLNPSSSTGFGAYSGTISIDQGLQATGWGLFAEVSGNRLINLDQLVSPDTDNDGIIDITELYLGISPISIDTDNDGLTDYEEIFTYNTDPNSSDSDGDGMPDEWEVSNNLNPIVNDASGDTDGDGLTNLQEFQNNTNPNNPDTDGDGLTDYEEVITYNTDPNSSDSDADGMLDDWEVSNNLNPIVDDASGDLDGDGLTNLQEFQNNTDPNSSDSDADGMLDGWEVSNNLNPIVDDASGDLDGDGLTNLQEFQNNTDPNNPDSDGDGMPDGWEVSNNLNPIVDDASDDPDGDGLTNLQEFQNGSDPNIPNSIFIEVPPDQTIPIGTYLNLTWIVSNLNVESSEIYLDGEIIENGLYIVDELFMFPIMDDLGLLPGDHEFTIEITDNLGNVFSDTVIITIEIEYGDVNDDGVVDIVDALLTAQYYVGINIPGFHAEAADVNLDGLIDIVDALLIAQYYVGQIDQLPT